MRSLEDLATFREALLNSELAAWLHDWEKCTDKHIFSNVRGGGSENNASQANTFLTSIPPWGISLLEDSLTIQELIEIIQEKSIERMANHWLAQALYASHSAAHTEKELVFFKFSQALNNSYKSTPFGYEGEKLRDLDRWLDSLSRFIKSSSGLVPERSDIEQEIERNFSHACGDTRLPINDVTLWNWSRMAAALYKAALVEAVLNGQPNPNPTKWRLFSVRLDGSGFLNRVSRIPDLLARQDLITDGLNKVRRLLEESYPLGTEIYRDENGSVFIVPNLDICKLEDKKETLFNLVLQAFSEGTVKGDKTLKLYGEIVPTCKVDKESWEWKNPYYEMNLTSKQIMEKHNDPLPIAKHVERENPLLADPSVVDSWWQGYREDICSVCQLRPQGWGARGSEAHYRRRARGEKCPSKPVCQTCKAIDRKVCAVCEERREDSAKNWAGKRDKTIWIDEVADIHGMVALVVGKFGLEHWFTGELLFYPQERQDGREPIRGALRVKNVGKQLGDGDVVPIGGNEFTWHEKKQLLVTGLLDTASKFKPPTPFKSNRLYINDLNLLVTVKDIYLLPSGHYRIILNSCPPELVAGRNYSIQEQEFRVPDEGSYLETASDSAKELIKDKILHFRCLKIERSFTLPVLEPPPARMIEAQAPTRLYRVWETTRTFWEQVVNSFGEKETVGKVAARLRTYTSEQDFLVVSHAYELKMDNANLSIVCTKKNEVFITDNLRRTARLLGASKEQYEDELAAAEFIKGVLEKKKEFDIEESTGYSSFNKVLGKLHILGVEVDTTPYTPAIQILSEPQTFMALVPANKALNVADALKKKYELEMGKVQNRLPMTMGIIFAGCRTPLPAILDAGRRILRQSVGSEEWVIDDVDKSKRPEIITLKVRRGEQSSTLKVPTIMGDEVTEDVWYPYLRLEKSSGDVEKPERLFKLNVGERSEYWIHVSDLQIGDIVSFMPSRLDFEFLDTAARRFEISYDDGKRRGIQHPARPYYLEQLDEFEKLWRILNNKIAGITEKDQQDNRERGEAEEDKLASSQIHNLIGLIETKRLEWREDKDEATFERMVRDILQNAGWKSLLDPESDEYKLLLRAAVSGQLTDVVEIYLGILKNPDEMGGNQ